MLDFGVSFMVGSIVIIQLERLPSLEDVSSRDSAKFIPADNSHLLLIRPYYEYIIEHTPIVLRYSWRGC